MPMILIPHPLVDIGYPPITLWNVNVGLNTIGLNHPIPGPGGVVIIASRAWPCRPVTFIVVQLNKSNLRLIPYKI